MRSLAITLALVVGALLLLQPSSADAEPEVTYLFPTEGDVLATPPPVIRMCFANPVDITDLHLGGDFSFSVVMPNDIGLGLRIVFQLDGLGVDVLPGIPENAPPGEWQFDWRVRDAGTKEPATGTLHFTVGPDGSPVPEEPPESCGPGTATPGASPSASPGATPGASPGATPDASPGATPGATPDASPGATPAGGQNDDNDNGPDILAVSLITTAAVIGAAAVGLILYLVRRKIGFSPHEPPRGEGGGGGH